MFKSVMNVRLTTRAPLCTLALWVPILLVIIVTLFLHYTVSAGLGAASVIFGTCRWRIWCFRCWCVRCWWCVNSDLLTYSIFIILRLLGLCLL
jgi:hypothetical protein